MLLPLQPGAANVADEPPLDLVHRQMLLEALLLRVRHVALGTAKQHRPVEGRRDVHLARLLALRFRGFRFVLSLFARLARRRRRWRRRRGISVGGRRRGGGRRGCWGLVEGAAAGVAAGAAVVVLEAAVRLTAVRTKVRIVVGVVLEDFPLDEGATRRVGYRSADQVVPVGQRYMVIATSVVVVVVEIAELKKWLHV